MTFVVVGLSHRTAPIEVREKLAFGRDEAELVAARLRALPGVEEGMLLLYSVVRPERDSLSSGSGPDPDGESLSGGASPIGGATDQVLRRFVEAAVSLPGRPEPPF